MLFKMLKCYKKLLVIMSGLLIVSLMITPINGVLAEVLSIKSDHFNYHNHIPSPLSFENEDSMREKALGKAKQEFIEKRVLADKSIRDMTWNATSISFSADGEKVCGWAVSGFEYFDVYSCFVTQSGTEAYILNTTTLSQELGLWQAEKGIQFTWTLEDKAFFGSIYRENSPDTLPDENAISLDKAVVLSKQYCMDTYKLSSKVLDQYYIDPYFQSTVNSWESYGCDYIWIICFRDKTREDNYKLKYQVRLSAENGELIDIGVPDAL